MPTLESDSVVAVIRKGISNFISVNISEEIAMVKTDTPFYKNVIVPRMKIIKVKKEMDGTRVLWEDTEIEIPRYVHDLMKIYRYDSELIDARSTPGADITAFRWVFKKYNDNIGIKVSISNRIPVVVSMHDFKLGIVPANPTTQLNTPLDPDVVKICAIQERIGQMPKFKSTFHGTSYSYFIKKPSVVVAVHNIPRFSLDDIYFAVKHPFKLMFKKLRYAKVPIYLTGPTDSTIVTFNDDILDFRSIEDARTTIVALLNDVTLATAAALM